MATYRFVTTLTDKAKRLANVFNFDLTLRIIANVLDALVVRGKRLLAAVALGALDGRHLVSRRAHVLELARSRELNHVEPLAMEWAWEVVWIDALIAIVCVVCFCLFHLLQN